jgi:hypothetical protein
MFKGRRGSRAADVAALSVVSAGQIVWDAEGTVRQAWVHELLRRQAHLEFARSAASNDRAVALDRLNAAQRDGDPREINTAHIALEQALDDVRQSSLACEQVRRRLRAALDSQARAAKERAVASLVRQLKRNRSVIAASCAREPGDEAVETGSVPKLRRPSRWRFRVVVHRTAGLRQS